MTIKADQLHTTIETRLADAMPDVELLACEPIAAARLRVTIDHPDGVDLGLCERVTHQLSDLLVDYGLEVSSVSYTHLTLRRIERCRSRWSPYH